MRAVNRSEFGHGKGKYTVPVKPFMSKTALVNQTIINCNVKRWHCTVAIVPYTDTPSWQSCITAKRVFRVSLFISWESHSSVPASHEVTDRVLPKVSSGQTVIGLEDCAVRGTMPKGLIVVTAFLYSKISCVWLEAVLQTNLHYN